MRVRDAGLLALFVTAYVALRVTALETPPDWRGDERTYLFQVASLRHSLEFYNALQNPPGPAMLTAPFAAAAAVLGVSSWDEWGITLWGRIVTLLASIGVGLLFLRLARSVLPADNRRALRWLAAVLLVVHLPDIVWSTNFSQNPFGVFWTLAAEVALVRWLTDQRKRWVLAAGLLTGAGVACSMTVGIVALQALLVFLHRCLLVWRRPRALVSCGLLFVVAMAAGFAVLAPGYVLHPERLIGAVAGLRGVMDQSSGRGHLLGVWHTLPAPLLALGLCGMALALLRPRHGATTALAVLALLWLAVGVAMGSECRMGRMMPLGPPMILLACAALERLMALVRGRTAVVWIPVAVLVAWMGVGALGVARFRATDHVRATVGEHLLATIPAGEEICLVEPPYWFTPDVIREDWRKRERGEPSRWTYRVLLDGAEADAPPACRFLVAAACEIRGRDRDPGTRARLDRALQGRRLVTRYPNAPLRILGIGVGDWYFDAAGVWTVREILVYER